jgi:ferritin-like metal-binding protein YciE
MPHPINRYLEDAIAAEKSFETQLRGFAKEASLPGARMLFEQHAEETKTQHKDLTAQLEALGGGTSAIKGMLAQVFTSAPKIAQIGHEKSERTTQDLMMAFAVENAEMAMYESLAIAAQTMGDRSTEALARRIQAQEQAAAEKVWALIGSAAAQAFRTVASDGSSQPSAVLIRYLQDTEAAERNFEDALSSFSKSGDQSGVQSLMAMMSAKARTQHERLAARLAQLHASPSTAKSVLAHMLAFTPLTAQMGQDDSEKSTQYLMITYAAAAAEMAMYEALVVVANEAGDMETASLARELQEEEREDHRLAWQALSKSARGALQAVLSHS